MISGSILPGKSGHPILNESDTADRDFDNPVLAEDFVHETDELLMILEGSLELEINGKVSRPAVGEEVFIPAGARHSVRNLGSTGSRWLYGYKTRND